MHQDCKEIGFDPDSRFITYRHGLCVVPLRVRMHIGYINELIMQGGSVVLLHRAARVGAY